MAWNDDRVELLKKLWADGLSASQIAGRLGGVTRNAVIGKVHRLGLSGRATTSRMKSHRPRARAQAAKRLMKPRFANVGNPALRNLYLGDTEPYVPPAEELVIPAQRAQIHPDAHRNLLPLADRRPAAGRFPLLRQEEDRGPALLRGACAPCLPAAAGAPSRSRLRAGGGGRLRAGAGPRFECRSDGADAAGREGCRVTEQLCQRGRWQRCGGKTGSAAGCSSRSSFLCGIDTIGAEPHKFAP